MAAERQLRKVSCEELDRRIRAPVGFTSRFLSGLAPFKEERALELRAAMGYDEERFQQEMLYRKAYRKAARGTSWIRSPHKPRARNNGSAPQQPEAEDQVVEDDEEEPAPRQPPVPEAVHPLAELLTLIRPDPLSRHRRPPAASPKRK
jgi:hypothetical protein